MEVLLVATQVECICSVGLVLFAGNISLGAGPVYIHTHFVSLHDIALSMSDSDLRSLLLLSVNSYLYRYMITCPVQCGMKPLIYVQTSNCNCWSLGMDKLFHHRFYHGWEYCFILLLKLTHISERGIYTLRLMCNTLWTGRFVWAIRFELSVGGHRFFHSLYHACLLILEWEPPWPARGKLPRVWLFTVAKTNQHAFEASKNIM